MAVKLDLPGYLPVLLPEASWAGAAAIAVQTAAVMGLISILMFFGAAGRGA